jgi:AbiV family abortive infection protein
MAHWLAIVDAKIVTADAAAIPQAWYLRSGHVSQPKPTADDKIRFRFIVEAETQRAAERQARSTVAGVFPDAMGISVRIKQSRPMPTPEQARRGVIETATNAATLLIVGSAGAHLAYGPSIGLLVLALEEAVKARALMAYVRASAKPGSLTVFDEEQFVWIIHQAHELRHVLALFQGVSDETREMLLGLREWPDASDAENAQLRMDLDFGEWLRGASDLKERGWYTNFDGTNWHSPFEITPDELKRTTFHVNRYIEGTLDQARNHLRPGEMLPNLKFSVRNDDNPLPTITLEPQAESV